jgi:TDG/mug DNA glycosylase family protein
LTPASPKPKPKPPSDVPDVLEPGLRVVFCGINPGRVSAAAGAHFANPRNDFWRLLHETGFTPSMLAPEEQFRALDHGIGLTNAASRTTPGSADLRRADFDGAAERLEALAAELRPEWLAFVGKEAYRGTFAERAELGLQTRRLSDTRLFVLPSTSPANAAVPYGERLRWFDELAARVSGKPLRDAVRALVLDPADRVLLVRFDSAHGDWWACPGGGLEPGETDEHAIARELAEEAGIRAYELGPCIWTREHWFRMPKLFAGQRERIYLVRVPPLQPRPELSWDALREEGMTEVRWWTRDELNRSREVFAPLRLPELVAAVLDGGAPAETLVVRI